MPKMKYKGHLTIEGDAPWGKPHVVSYAEPYPDAGWIQCNPAQLNGCPENFDAGNGNFKRPYIMLNPEQMRVETDALDNSPALILYSYPLDGIDPMVSMRRLNNMALQFSQMCGFSRWAVVLKHPERDKFPEELPTSGEIPDPVEPKTIQLANEHELRQIEDQAKRLQG